MWTLRQHFAKERSGFVQKVPIGYCAGYFLKVPTAYLLGMSQANWHALFKNDQDLPAGCFAGQIGGYFSKVPCWVWAGGIGGYFLKVFTTYLLGMSQANCFITHNKLTTYPLGKLPFAPSVTCLSSRYFSTFSFHSFSQLCSKFTHHGHSLPSQSSSCYPVYLANP